MSPIGDFNRLYFDFIQFIKLHLEDDPNFKTFYRKNILMKEVNPKYFIHTWNERITKLYYEQISKFNIDFFLNKDYTNDVKGNSESNMLMVYIIKFKKAYDTLEDTIKKTFVNFIVNLTHLSFLYYK
uniref:Uncharacterized protein n=1 Tax=viral metagenome TaxID=1070528 RepID=A0A6C0EUU0_9ZZZZ